MHEHSERLPAHESLMKAITERVARIRAHSSLGPRRMHISILNETLALLRVTKFPKDCIAEMVKNLQAMHDDLQMNVLGNSPMERRLLIAFGENIVSLMGYVIFLNEGSSTCSECGSRLYRNGKDDGNLPLGMICPTCDVPKTTEASTLASVF